MDMTLGYLTALYGANGGASTGPGSMLETLYGYAGSKANSLGQNPAAALASAERNETRNIRLTAAEPEVKRAMDSFTAGGGKGKNVEGVLGEPAVIRVLMTANGLADQIPYTALARKALQSNLSDPKSLANRLADTRWKPMVQTYDFANKGLSVIQDPKVIATIANAYAEVTWRKS